LCANTQQNFCFFFVHFKKKVYTCRAPTQGKIFFYNFYKTWKGQIFCREDRKDVRQAYFLAHNKQRIYQEFFVCRAPYKNAHDQQGKGRHTTKDGFFGSVISKDCCQFNNQLAASAPTSLGSALSSNLGACSRLDSRDRVT
jgi:hypothetical protein